MYKKLIFVIGVMLLIPGTVFGEPFDLTLEGHQVIINNAIFMTPSEITSGTGLIDSFLRIQRNGQEEGYNTDGEVQFQTKTGTFTHSLTLADIQANETKITDTMDIPYYEFVLDINQTGSGSLLSLTDLEIWLSDRPDHTDYEELITSSTSVYDLDSNDLDNDITLDYANFAGSGNLDMIALIPQSLFDIEDTSRNYVYLYSRFGSLSSDDGFYPSNDGFEEWAHKLEGTFYDGPAPESPFAPVPEPATLLLLGSGLIGISLLRKPLIRRKS